MGELGAADAPPPSFLMYPLVATLLADGALVEAP
jgi:hypothetical protein